MSMKIVVTNDDGYQASGLWVAYDLAHKLGGQNAEIYVIAPKVERSGVGHAISYLQPFQVNRVRERHYVVDGYPADCVLVSEGILGAKPDLVISGVNHGHNLGPDQLYSGTVGAAIEAVAHGIPAIALSQYYRAHMKDDDAIFASARGFGLTALLPLWKRFGKSWPEGKFCNINFPPNEVQDVKGVKMVQSEPLLQTKMRATKQPAPNGKEYYWIGHEGHMSPNDLFSDVVAVQEGYVTVSFCHTDLSDYQLNQDCADLYPSPLIS